MTYKKVLHEHSLLEHYVFYNNHFSCKIFPHLGGSIQELIIGDITLIKGIPMSDTGIEYYKTNFPSSLLFPFPNRIDRGKYKFNNINYQLPANEHQLNNAIHGLVYNASFKVCDVSENGLTLNYQNNGHSGFPFSYNLRLNYHFSTDGFSLDLKVQNTGTHEFPFGLGWHPYFELGTYNNCSIHFSADKKYSVNDRLIPFDSEPYTESKINLKDAHLDTAFRLTDSTIKLKSPKYDLLLKIPQDSFLQLYTPKERDALAIEPMSCIANSFNNGIGLQKLSPKEEFQWNMTLEMIKK